MSKLGHDHTVLTSASVVVVTFRWPDDAIQNDGAHLEFRCSSNQKNDKIQKKKHKNDKKKFYQLRWQCQQTENCGSSAPFHASDMLAIP